MCNGFNFNEKSLIEYLKEWEQVEWLLRSQWIFHHAGEHTNRNVKTSGGIRLLLLFVGNIEFVVAFRLAYFKQPYIFSVQKMNKWMNICPQFDVRHRWLGAHRHFPLLAENLEELTTNIPSYLSLFIMLFLDSSIIQHSINERKTTSKKNQMWTLRHIRRWTRV